jgi:glycosyltransferase involved in cell wall biosynthesis
MPHESAGGGFNYAMDIISEIDRYNFDPSVRFIFLSFSPYKEPYLKHVSNKEIFRVPSTSAFSSRYLNAFSNVYNFFFNGKYRIGRKLNSLARRRLKLSNVKAIKDKNIHLLFYPVQQEALYDDIPFVSNNWDLGHLSTYSFPELIAGNQYEYRNYWYNTTLRKAFAIFTESEQGKDELRKYLHINPDKIKIVPHFYSAHSFLQDNLDEIEFLKKNSLMKDQYLFYPAQFWAHKNHYNLIEGFNQFIGNDTQKNIKLVLTGADQGNLQYVLKLIREKNLENHIQYLGFVSKAEISVLYKNALCLIFPSFLGPSNLPLIEALYHDCLVMCSDLEGHREMCNDAALYFNPEIPADISDTILKMIDKNTQSNLRSARDNWVKSDYYSSQKVMGILEKNFLELRNIRLCWQ